MPPLSKGQALHGHTYCLLNVADCMLFFKSTLFLLNHILQGNFLSRLQGENKYHSAQTEGTIKIIANLSTSGREPPKVIFGNVPHRPSSEYLNR